MDDKEFQEELRQIYQELARKQEPLDPVFLQVLEDNREDLYEE